jgi:hypothetical protein
VCKLAVHPTKRSTKPVVLAVQGMYYIVAGRLSFSLEGRRYRVNEGRTPIISSWNFEQNDDAKAIVKVALIGIWHWIMIIKRLGVTVLFVYVSHVYVTLVSRIDSGISSYNPPCIANYLPRRYRNCAVRPYIAI